jgi:Zn-dependent peptidase ImmA (M78 family)/transcriptional regulator with XRE-family HTH domain
VSVDAREAAAHFDPRRLKLARQLQAITRAEVANRAEISAAAVSQFESGANHPKAATVARLSLALKVPVTFLASPGQATLLPTVDESFFRSLRRTSKRDRERAAALAGLAAELVRAIERQVLLPTFADLGLALDPGDVADAAEDAARKVRSAWSIPDGPIDNVVRLLERHGVAVFRSALASDNAVNKHNVDAFSWTQGPRPIVVLGTEKDVYERSRLDAAHELGHVLLHASDPDPANKPMERQAQRFGSALLAPAELFVELWPSGRLDWKRLMQVRQELGLSLAAVLYRARDLGLMSATSYTNAMKYMSRRGWRVREPGPRITPEQPALISAALDLLAGNGTSFDELATSAQLIAADELRTCLGLNQAKLPVAV